MDLAPNTPIIVGIADRTQPTPTTIEDAKSPVDLAAQASELALADAGLSADSVSALVVVRTSTDSVPMAQPPLGTSNNPPASVANRIGASPAVLIHSPSGGNTPQQLVNQWAEKLADGFAGCVLLTGAEALATVKAASQLEGVLDWNENLGASCEDHGSEIEGMIAVDDMRHGMSKPTTQYAIAENARRSELKLSYKEHALAVGKLLAPFSAVAQENEYAVFSRAYSPDEIATLSESNRYVDFPYTFRMIAKDTVNQAAAVIMTTVGRAQELGISKSKWVFLHSYAQAKDLPILKRQKLGQSKALTLTYAKALKDSGLNIDDISIFDLYSCFPIVVELAKSALGLGDDVQLTQTGGLPYFGGPGNNYSMHGITAVVRKLRERPDQYALVGANGGMINKHAVGIYSCIPGWKKCDSRNIQAEALLQDAPKIDRAPRGEASIESYTVSYSKGRPVHAVIIARLAFSGDRFVACSSPEDSLLIRRLLAEDCIGLTVFVAPTPKANIVVLEEHQLSQLIHEPETQFRLKYQFCSLEINQSVLEITIDRPDCFNALHPPANDELAQIFDVYMKRNDLRVAIITGSGQSAFCAGNDLKYSASGKPFWVPKSGFAGITSREGRNKPIIAAVNGVAAGGGFEVAMASDIVVAGSHSEFSLPEVKRGLIAAAGGAVRLPRQIPEKLAMEMILTGESVSAERALRLGIVNHVVAPENVMSKARAIAKKIAANSPTSVRLTLEMQSEMANQGDVNIASGGIPEVLDKLICSEDFYEGPNAFSVKREPKWTGN